MSMRTIYAAAAASLLVALGLGLIYLVVMDRISAGAALGTLLAGAGAIPLVVALRELAEKDPRE